MSLGDRGNLRVLSKNDVSENGRQLAATVRQRARIYIFDGNEADLRGRVSQITAAELDVDWDIVATPSRNQLLTWIDRDARTSPRRQSVALIDYRTESGDIEQLGFRIVELIRRHAYLWKATRPIVWVDHLTSENVSYARGVAAEAIVDDAWVDRSPAAALQQVFAWGWQRSTAPYGPRAEPPRIFTDAAPTFDQEAAQRDAHFQRSFEFAPDELDYKILWGMAGAVELQFLDRHCAAEGWARSERAARKAREKLQQAMRREREELDRAEPTNAELARRFLADAMPGTPDPLAELSWPALTEVRGLCHKPTILHSAFLEPEAERILDRFLLTLSATEVEQRERGDTVSTSGRLEIIETALQQVAANGGQAPMRIHGLVHRSCHALSDAFDDWRRFGEPRT